ncbi:MAG TPA: hypothetical protein VNX67_07370 [Solirubrobacteraceae bacterium]|jgi:uncharacterized repeat protein (TIGR01451 family)|nr:hypothetical protein [Solirubrobacteraceae bacterium]
MISRNRIKGLALVVALAVIGALAPVDGAVLASASAPAPVWNVKARWGDTNPQPGSTVLFIVDLNNIGEAESNTFPTPPTVVDQLPAGFTFIAPKPDDEAAGNANGSGWKCTGATTVTCTWLGVTAFRDEPRGSSNHDWWTNPLFFAAKVSGSASGAVTNVATASGGGALAPSTDTEQITIGSGPTTLGFVPGSFEGDVFDAAWPAGNPVRQAGAHPFEQRVNFGLKLNYGEVPLSPNLTGVQRLQSSPTRYLRSAGDAKTIEVVLPRGMIGNAQATPKCPLPEFLAGTAGLLLNNVTGCPADTQVGTLTLDVLNSPANQGGYGNFAASAGARIPVYNLVPPKGVPSDFGFDVSGLYDGHIFSALDPAHDYAIKASVPAISSVLNFQSSQFSLWGVPADPAHDNLRAVPNSANAFGTPANASFIKPLLTMPMDCGTDNNPFQLRGEFWEQSGQWTPTESSPQSPLDVSGCEDERIRFNPQIALQPTTRDAGAPTGLDVHLEVPQRNEEVQNASELYPQSGSIKAIPVPPIKKAVITLPEGMTISTSAAQGLGTCSAEEIGLGTDSPIRCPANSRYGQLVIHTPLLPSDEPMMGDIYIAKRNENPFHNFLSMYFVIHDENRGLLIKVPGRIDLDPSTGRITSTFDDLPQFPISDMELTFKSGVRSALVNPTTCGEKTITATFYSWSSPEVPVTRTSSYDVTRKPDGSPCVSSLSNRPFAPQLTAGTVSPSAGGYSQFLFRLTRGDDDQELSTLNIGLPPGLSANISQITKCPELAIAQATNALRTGTEEVNSPSCPASSQLGTVDIGSGVGVPLYYFSGKMYLAGPYNGAPLSTVVIVPAIAGPYDLGVTAVRSALFIDPHTSQVRVSTDPFPQIYQGIPVRIRDIRVKIDRPNTTFNPTSCNPMQITGNLTSSFGASASVYSRFQAANCGGLTFHPGFRVTTPGHTSRATGAGLTVKLTYPNAPQGTQANIAKVKVDLPKQLPSRLTTLQKACPDTVFDSNPAGCPAASLVGHATAVTPILPVSLSGPAYFVSHGGAAFPDLIVVLQGYGVTIDLTGSTFISKAGITSSTFKTVPDVPVGSFELTLPQGPGSALAANGNLCKSKLAMPTAFTAQNGAVIHQSTKITVTGCPRAKKASRKHRASNAARRHHGHGRGK